MEGSKVLRVVIASLLTTVAVASNISSAWGADTSDDDTVDVIGLRWEQIMPDPMFYTTPTGDEDDYYVDNTSGGDDSGGPGTGDDGKVPDNVCPKSGNPVVLATGNKVETEKDFATSGEMPLDLVRNYNHYWQGIGLFGKHWVSSFDYKLTFGTTVVDACYPRAGGGACGLGTNTVVYSWRPDGRVIKFIKNVGNGIFYEDKPSPVAYITQEANGSFVLRGEKNEYETYSSAGYVSTVGNGAGINWTFTYTSGTYLSRVTHTSGRYVEFVWNNGLPAAVRDPAGNYFGYAYNANFFGAGMHRLLASSKPGAVATTIAYHYEWASDPGALTGKSFNGVRYSKFAYDYSGRAISSEHNGLEKFTFAYTAGANGLFTVLETNPLGKKATYSFQDGKLTSVVGQASAYCASTYVEIVYDANGYPSLKSDANGNVTTFSYNAKGQLLQKVEAHGTPSARTTQYVWDTTRNRVLTITVVGVSRTTYDYGPLGRPYRIAVTNLSPYGIANQTLETFYSYTDYGGMLPNGVHVAGMLATVTVDGPLAGTTDSTITQYDTLGNLVSVKNGLGYGTVYSSHNGLGQPARATGANGDITDFTYDERGRLTRTRTYPNGSTPADTLYAYAGNGELSAITSPYGVVTNRSYDSGLRLTSQTQAVSGILAGGGTEEQQLFSYNLASDVVSTKKWAVEGHYENTFVCRMPIGASETNCAEPDIEQTWVIGPVLKESSYLDYDELSRVRARRGNGGQNVRYTYDLNGNIKTVTDSMNRVTTLTWDAMDRVVQSKDPYNNLTNAEYDLAGNVKKLTDARGKITTYIYDGFGHLWAESSPDTGTTAYVWNAYGQLAQMTRSNGAITAYTYDPSGRLASATSGSRSTTYGYDWCTNGKDRLCNVDGPNTLLHYAYEPDGRTRIRREIYNVNSAQSDYWTNYFYNAQGDLSAITYPNGQAVGYGYTAGRVKTMTLNVGGTITNVISNSAYAPFGDVIEMTFGNGLQRVARRDLDGRIGGITLKDGASAMQNLTFTYTQNNEISKITNGVNASMTQTYGYELLSRLVSVTSPSGNQNITYDANGNRTTHNWNGVLDTYNVSTTNNRIDGISSASPNGPVEYQYDGLGNRTYAHHHGIYIASYGYDEFNRMSAVSYFNGSVSTNNAYEYNGLNERIWKSAPAVGYYRYVYGPGSRLIAEHKDNGDVWTNYLWFGDQLVGMVRGGQTTFIHNDQLGRPELATNTAKAAVWRASNYAFDRTVTLDSIQGLNVGLPGHYYDQEMRLWYNVNRYYDARTGRYTQADPVGLKGGMNTYSYASNNPITRMDPLGLTDWSGTALEYGGGPYSGGTYTLSNKCEGNGEPRYLVRVQATAGGFSSLPRGMQTPLSYVGSNVEFSDGAAMPDPQVFNGIYVSYGISISPGVGVGFGITRLGDASSGWGWSALFGLDESVGGAVGESRVLWAQPFGTCPCTK